MYSHYVDPRSQRSWQISNKFYNTFVTYRQDILSKPYCAIALRHHGSLSEVGFSLVGEMVTWRTVSNRLIDFRLRLVEEVLSETEPTAVWPIKRIKIQFILIDQAERDKGGGPGGEGCLVHGPFILYWCGKVRESPEVLYLDNCLLQLSEGHHIIYFITEWVSSSLNLW